MTWWEFLGIMVPSVCSIVAYLVRVERRLAKIEGKLAVLLGGDPPNGQKGPVLQPKNGSMV